MPKILIVEDDVRIARFIELELLHENYEVDVAHDGITGCDKALNPDVSLVLLDVMLPGMSGMEVCEKVRKKSEVPIIMLTARDEVADKVRGLSLGVDDYMTKPFAIEELLARIKMVLTRRKGAEPEQTGPLVWGNLVMDTAVHSVSYDGEDVLLTKKEYELLEYLLKGKNAVHSREELLSKVWEYEYIGETNIVDVYIRYIRQKIENKYNIHMIETIRGVGYIIKD